ncbi:unnamed protein product [Brassica napus]|uniref:(rape) hypothetical protein n=1 Tax=Brassica napus TaxID=3708 RepID=A0A816L1H4_BRANA|nr:unnamed protein product [Brassica napus]
MFCVFVSLDCSIVRGLVSNCIGSNYLKILILTFQSLVAY